MKKIAVTLGDPNGISPEITIKALNFLDLPKDKVVLIANKNVLDFYEEKYDLYLEKEYEIVEIPYAKEDVKVGVETEEAGEFSFCAIRKACDLALNGEVQAIVTAPVSKNALHLAGHKYSGQTEIIERYIARENQKAEMLFVSDNFSVMLITRHVAIKDIPSLISKEMIIEKVKTLKKSFETQLGFYEPRFVICALNPHASENGLFGDEENQHIIPAVEELRDMGVNIDGPFPADTLFTACLKEQSEYDCYIAMYHDQGLIPIKLLQQQNSVNTTIGLDVIRTSPAHGTAFGIAGQIIADPSSMISAIELALK